MTRIQGFKRQTAQQRTWTCRRHVVANFTHGLISLVVFKLGNEWKIKNGKVLLLVNSKHNCFSVIWKGATVHLLYVVQWMYGEDWAGCCRISAPPAGAGRGAEAPCSFHATPSQFPGTSGLEDVCGIWKCVGEQIIQMPEARMGNTFKSYTSGKIKIY